MKAKIIIKIGLFFLFILNTSMPALPWDDKVTHTELTTYSAINSELSGNRDDYLATLGFRNGLSEQIKWDTEVKTVIEWLAKGARLEDSAKWREYLIGKGRSYNHFHNPLKPWEEAGLDDWVILPIGIPPFQVKGQSSLLWAQDAINQEKFLEGNWSWERVRKDYCKAVTAGSEVDRQEYFAQTFRGLGHQLHLVQDATVPYHVRNDAHPEDGIGLRIFRSRRFEKWASEENDFIISILESSGFAVENYLPTVALLDPVSLSLDSAYMTRKLSPSALFIDTDLYNGGNPSTRLSIGLAEYTNANFFSEDTIFAAETYPVDHRHYFPYPNQTSTDLQDYITENKLPETIISEDDVVETGFWIAKDKHGEVINHFLKPIYFAPWLFRIYPDEYQRPKVLSRAFYEDETCFKDYAEKLIPRAVGYSAGLLNYFFRGTLEISIPEDQVLSIMEGIANPHWIVSVTAKLRNTSAREKDATGEIISYEEMKKGELRGVVRYKKGLGDGYFYAVSKPVSILSLSHHEFTEFDFDFSDDPIPSGIRDASLFAVFKGTLGHEKDIAVAVGMRPLLAESVEITLPPQGAYAQTEDPEQGFCEIKLLARNVGTDEMPDGSIELVVQYRLALEDPFQSKPVPISEHVYYSVVPERNNTRSISKDRAAELIFDLSQTPIPLYATNLYLQVVYRGIVDAKAEALAVGLKDVSEPTPMNVFNNMDFICLNGNWYEAGSPEAIAQVDLDGDGIAEPGEWNVYPHDLKDIYIRFSSASAPQYASTSEYNFHIHYLSAGEFLRTGFILHDYQLNFGDRVIQLIPTHPDDHFSSYMKPGTFASAGIKNQTRYGKQSECCEALGIPPCMDYSDMYCCERVISELGCKIINYPTLTTFRGEMMWMGLIYDNTPYPPNSSCPY